MGTSHYAESLEGLGRHHTQHHIIFVCCPHERAVNMCKQNAHTNHMKVTIFLVINATSTNFFGDPSFARVDLIILLPLSQWGSD